MMRIEHVLNGVALFVPTRVSLPGLWCLVVTAWVLL